jgi:DNA-binding GntR family transcriptional regulator
MMAKGELERSSADEAYDEIQRLIVIGALSAYELLSEGDLVRRTGCGRTPVREALQRLKFEGFVDVLPRRGIMVTPVDITRQLELLETRRPCEVLMVSLAAHRATDAQRERMRELADELEAAVSGTDRDKYLELNKETHVLEAQATHNQFLIRQMTLLHSLSRRFWYSFIADTKSFSQAAKLHGRTLRAVADGEPVEAQAECLALLDLLEQVSRSALEDRMNSGSGKKLGVKPQGQT